MNKKNQKFMQIMALSLAILMAAGAVFGILFYVL